eukprot:jgi/Chrzof1/9088/Cz03g35190.t1
MGHTRFGRCKGCKNDFCRFWRGLNAPAEERCMKCTLAWEQAQKSQSNILQYYQVPDIPLDAQPAAATDPPVAAPAREEREAMPQARLRQCSMLQYATACGGR